MSTILIIEDNPSHMKLAATVLERSGYTVLPADNAQAGLALAHSAAPDLVLMDIQLPDMDGVSAIRALKADSQTRSIPVVAVTSFLDTYPEAQARGAGAVAFIAKPYHYKDFLAVVAQALGQP